MDNDFILHSNATIIIFINSFCQLIPFSFSIYYKIYPTSLITITTFFTSINYWRKPTKYTIRRYTDISCVLLGILYHLYLIFYFSLSYKYYYIIATGSLLYPIQYTIHKKHYYYIAFCHSLLQFIASIICTSICHDIHLRNITY
jgi:hypothetical protein